MFKRVFLIVLDSLGVGEAIDAKKWNDEGANTLGHLVEKFYGFKQERHDIMVQKYKLFTEDIFKHRTIYGDGNCFYRSVLFSYLEQLILFKELNAIKNFIFDVKAFLGSSQVKDILQKLDEIPKLDGKLILRILK